MKWTTEQALAIELRNKNILVAAAAGSGKTAVLVERIKRLILEERCPIDRMLIVTFTNAAAAEMKEKIRKAVNQAVGELAQQADSAEPGSPEQEAATRSLVFLKQQLNLLPQAQISTFHAFALEIIRKYFYIIDVEPNFKICDDAQQTILRSDAMDELLAEAFAEGDSAFLHFLDCYSGDRNEEKFREMVEKTYNTIQALPEPYVWLDEKVKMLQQGGGEGLQPVLEFLWQLAEENLRTAEGVIEKNRKRAEEAELSAAVQLAEDDLKQIALLREALGDYDGFRTALGNFKLGTLRKTVYQPPKESSLSSEEAEALKHAASAGRDLAKKEIKALRDEYFAQNLETIGAEMMETSEDAALLQKLVIRYGQLYDGEKKKRGLVDFHDIEHYAYEILKDEEVSGYFREKFLHVFVDEYQDSNVMQEAFLARVCRENNLFLVGDVKQSIYKFRLAEPEIFQKRYRDYAACGDADPSVKIDLNRNFRSKRPVIDFINQVFRYTMEDYDENAELYMGDPFGDHFYDVPKLCLTNAPWEESEEIGDELKTMMKAEKEALAAVKIIRDSLGQPVYDSKAQTMRPLELQDIVILMRGIRGYGDIFYNVLMENGIPAYVDDNDGYFDTMEINTMLALLRIIDNEKQDVPLLTVLRSEIFGFTIPQLAEIRIFSKEGTYGDAFFLYGQRGPDAALRAKCAAAAVSLREWQSRAVFLPLEELVWNLMLETGFYLAMGAMPGGRQRQANLRALVDKALVCRKGEQGTLYGFIRYMDAVKEKKVAAGQVKLVGEGDGLVRMMTIHKSKGLEFPMVILAGFCKGLNYTRGSKNLSIHKDLGLGLPIINKKESWYRTTMLQKLIRAKFHQEEVAEEKRILYVALTRAKDRLVLLGICGDVQEALDWAGSEPPKASDYFRMTGNRICTGLKQYEILEDTDLAKLVTYRQRKNDSVLELFDRDNHTGDRELARQVEHQLEFRYPGQRELSIKSKYSVSELNGAEPGKRAIDSLEEPASFKRNDVFTAAQRGTIYHTLLEHLDFRAAWAAGDSEAGRYEVEAVCRWLTEKQFLTDAEAAVIDVDLVMKLVQSELGQRLAAAEAEGLIWKEQPFNLKMHYDPDGSGMPSDVIVQGVIDCCFAEEDGLVLVDYKTSRISPDKNGGLPEKEKQRISQRYRTQMDIYRHALEVTSGRTVKEAYICLTDCGEVIEM